MMHSILALDQNTLLWIQDSVRSDALTPFFILLTRLGDLAMVWILVSMALLLSNRTQATGIMALSSLGLAALIDNVLLKNIIARIRPYEVVPGLQNLIEIQTDFSFPSGHTGSSFAVAVVLLVMLPKRYGIPAVILALLIGLSRLYLGVHYPTDVLAGILIGTLIAFVVVAIGAYWMRRAAKDRLVK